MRGRIAALARRFLAGAALAIGTLAACSASEGERGPTPPSLPERPSVQSAPLSASAPPTVAPATPDDANPKPAADPPARGQPDGEPRAAAPEPARAEPLDVPPDTDALPGAEAAAEALLRAARETERAQAKSGADARAAPAHDNSEAFKPVCDEPIIKGTVQLAAVERSGGTGAFDAKVVDRELQKRASALKACYEQSLRKDPALRGAVTVEFTLEPTGATSHVSTAANADARLATCLTDVVKRVRFQPGPDGGSVSYRCSVAFSPQET